MNLLWEHRQKFFACLGVLSTLALGLLSGQAQAATASTTFSVTATVAATCTISATNLAFGTYTGAVANSNSTITVTCTNTTPYNVGLNAGTAPSATVSTRAMTGPSSATLSYGLFQDATYATNWGDTIGTGGDTESGTGNGSAQALTVYGQIPAGQYPAPGTYTDTITATVTY